MKKQLWILFAFLALVPGLLVAQAKPSTKIEAKLVFFDDDTQVVITDAKGVAVTPTEGLSLQPGWVVKTKKSTVEIKLQPNGSIFKLTSNSTFRIDGLKDLDNSNSSDFALLNGKVRAVAAKLTGLTAPGYNLRTPTSNCGVRGTDFAVMFDPDNKKDWVCVQEGLVDFTNSITGQTVQVATNQFANTFDAVFQSGPVSADRLAQLFSDLNFQKLSPGEVPGNVVSSQPAAPAPTAAPTEPKDDTAANSGEDSLAWLKNLIGLEIGAVTINGTTYSKAVVSPVVNVGSLKLGLYLPVIYSNDLFNANDWYKPAGNNEWSFGSDSSYGSDWIGRSGDFATDVLLKIKFLEYGNPGFDPFYLKLGNLKTMGLGHGSIVRDFANDQEFPSVRKIGLNTGFKSGPFGAEALVDDLSSPKVLGARVSFDLVPDQFIFGFSTVADLFPVTAKGLKGFTGTAAQQDPAYWGDPSLIVGGLDFQLFKINTPVFSTIAFADINTITAAYRNSVALPTYSDQIAPGLATKTIFDNGFKSFGGEAGVYGNILIAQYRLSFQYEKGLYTNALFSSNYYRNQLGTALEIDTYLSSASKRDEIDGKLKLGIFGSAGFNLFNMFVFEAGYRLPMQQDASGIRFAGDDYLKLKLELLKDKLPLIKASGSITYERTGFVTGLRDGINLFDAKTLLKGEFVYGLVKGIDLVANVATNVVVDANGNVVYQGSLPKVTPSVSLETRVSF